MLKDKHGQSVFPSGAFARFLLFIAVMAGPTLLVYWLQGPPEPDLAMPYELREAAADCILNDTPKSCEIYEKAKPLYPIRNQ